MQIAESPNSLREFLDQRSLALEQAALVTLFAALVDWFESERAHDAAAIEDDGDMLLFQWGTYDWGGGSTFSYNLTRQFATSAADPADQEIWQLGLTAHYDLTAQLTRLGSANRWCGSPSECDDLREHIRASPATGRVAAEDPLRVEITFERV